MPEMDPIKWAAMREAAEKAFEDLAGMIASYMHELVAAGVTDPALTALLVDFQRHMLFAGRDANKSEGG